MGKKRQRNYLDIPTIDMAMVPVEHYSPHSGSFAWEPKGRGGNIAHRRTGVIESVHSGGKSHHTTLEAVFFERDVYDRPIGPEPLQYDIPLGPHLASEQYAEPAGPAPGSTIQYDRPAGPTRSIGERIGQKAGEAKETIVSARDQLYGYERTKSGKIKDSGVGRINFFEGNPFAGMDPMGVGGHPASRSFGKVGSPYRSGGRRSRNSRNED